MVQRFHFMCSYISATMDSFPVPWFCNHDRKRLPSVINPQGRPRFCLNALFSPLPSTNRPLESCSPRQCPVSLSCDRDAGCSMSASFLRSSLTWRSRRSNTSVYKRTVSDVLVEPGSKMNIHRTGKMRNVLNGNKNVVGAKKLERASSTTSTHCPWTIVGHVQSVSTA